MTDTPKPILDLQTQRWLAKSPGERLFQALKNNEEMFLLFKDGREQMKKIGEKKKSNPS